MSDDPRPESGAEADELAVPLTVYGATQSFFTRKVTGYLDYKQIPWHLRRGLAPSAEARAGGWPGGIPAVIDADGNVMWDSTSVILHLEHHRPAALGPAGRPHPAVPHVRARRLQRRVVLPTRGRLPLALPGERDPRQLGPGPGGRP